MRCVTNWQALSSLLITSTPNGAFTTWLRKSKNEEAPPPTAPVSSRPRFVKLKLSWKMKPWRVSANRRNRNFLKYWARSFMVPLWISAKALSSPRLKKLAPHDPLTNLSKNGAPGSFRIESTGAQQGPADHVGRNLFPEIPRRQELYSRWRILA